MTATTAADQHRWESTTAMAMAVDFLAVPENECSFECGKRLNRAVAAMLAHRGLAPHCVSLFAAPDKFVIVGKLRRLDKLYRELFVKATMWFAATGVDGCFRARERGIYVFGRSGEVVQQALRVVQSVVKQQLAPTIAWRFECERKRMSPLSRDDVSIVAASLDDVSSGVSKHGSRLRAVMLAFGRDEPPLAEVLERLRPAAQHLRLLNVAGWESAPVAVFEQLMAESTALVLSWRSRDALAATMALAIQFSSRFCPLAVADSDAVAAESTLRAMGFGEAMARELVGTQLATLALRQSAIRQAAWA
jgi:hypothetical protein